MKRKQTFVVDEVNKKLAFGFEMPDRDVVGTDCYEDVGERTNINFSVYELNLCFYYA